MILLAAFIGSLEFYAIAFAVAVALIVVMMRPSDKGEAITFSARGVICDADGGTGLTLTADSQGRLDWVRHGIRLESDDCQMACSVTVIGSDITITEKRALGTIAEINPHQADVRFTSMQTLRPGRYHVRYEAEWAGEWAAGYMRIPTAIEKRMEMHM